MESYNSLPWAEFTSIPVKASTVPPGTSHCKSSKKSSMLESAMHKPWQKTQLWDVNTTQDDLAARNPWGSVNPIGHTEVQSTLRYR